ncbi:hypothetical protein PCYB_004480 [Plasmodium cynomolgi strain B]|uniref:Uncharacterized protein n=1 Tax=Plasmodium cynomolgi (strain B) TaxID=1120755 RepID=K6V085_PLACD|nr:hypothetical protein PCYB_004480 [Plasmodium cynomolgi strain B]GAB69699.1 hypothetical protein PCYB_004480 [Plasmodium cynomolgi strain B]
MILEMNMIHFLKKIFKERTKYNVSITMDCSRLKKYLIKLDNEKGCKNKNCCKYINYVLNKMVHTYYDSNSSIFYIYNTYMNHKNNNKEIMNLCLKEINYMIPEKYKKINLLYNAYEKCQPYASKEYTNLKDFLEKNEPPLTSDCYPIFSVSLFYPYYCNELLKKKEKDNSYIDHPNTELVLLRAVVPGLEKRNSAVGEPEDGTDTEERATSVGTIIGTSLGIVLPLIVIYRVRKTYFKNKIILYEYLYYV